MAPNLNLRNKFLIATIGTVLLLGLSVLLIAKPLLQKKLFSKLEKRGASVAGQIASNSVNLVLTEKYFDLEMLLRDYKRSEDDIVYIFVLDDRDRVLAHTFDKGFPLDLSNANKADPAGKYSLRHLLTEEGEIVDIAVPLLKGQIGSLHVGISGKQIRQDVNSFVRWVIWLVVAILIAGGGTAILASWLITKPLLGLAKAAGKVAGGDLGQRVPVSSHDEIGQLEMIFNDMIEKQKQRQEEREKLIIELREALAKVRTLSGMLPICASCKKIRDDKGYWTQLEGYIRDHSEAEFSHSICPDCAKKLYPELYKK